MDRNVPPEGGPTPLSGRAWARYGFAIVGTLVAFAVRLGLTGAVGPFAFPFLLFFPAVTAAAWYGGLGPGILAILLSEIVGRWFFIRPIHLLSVPSGYDLSVMLGFAFACGFIVAAVATIRRARVRLDIEVRERRRAEAEITNAYERLSTTMASIGDAVIVTDAEGRVVSFNAEAERLTGWTQGEAAGKPLSEVFSIFHEETRRPAENPVDRVLRDGRVVALANHTVLRSRHGQEIPIDDSASPIRVPGGPILGVVLVFRDVTEARRAHDTRARLAAIVEYSGDAIVTKDLDGIVRTWNRSAEALFGYTPDEIIGKPITTIVPHELQDEETRILSRLRRGEPSERLETVRVTKDGRQLHVSLSVSPLRDRDGRVIGAAKVLHDVTEIVAGREALSRERELLATTLASIGDGVIVTDAEGRVSFLNSEAERLTGWTKEEARGHELPTVFRIVNEQTRRMVEDPVAKVFRLGTVVGLANHTLLIAKDGSERPIDDSAAPILLQGRTLSGVVLVFRDASERRIAVQRLRESEERFRLMADAAPVLIWRSGTDKLCTWFNKGWLDFVGRRMEQELGNGWAESVHPDDFERCLKTYVSAFDTRKPFTMTYRLRRHDGEWRSILDNGVPVYDAGGEFSGYIGSCVDATENVQAEEERRDADHRKDVFLAILSHELRNPLAPIRMAIGMLRRLGSPNQDVEKLRNIIDRQTAQLSHLLDDLLDVSRIASGKIVLRKERILLGFAISSAVESAEPTIRAHDHKLRVTMPEEPIYLDADLGRLAQVFTNLLQNAAKYTERGGTITLEAKREGGDAVVRVRDTGIGISPEQLTRVFEMFAQVDQSLTRGQGGLGVGLSLSKTLVELHGGQIEARSDGIGKGSEFTVRLPILGTVDGDAAPDEAAGDSRAMGGLRILVADDNEDSATLLAWSLRQSGHEVRTAMDGVAAVEAAASFHPELAILDIGMPRLNGYEAAKQIRSQSGSEVVLVAMTGWGQEEDKRRAMDAGFDYHLTKPVDLPTIEKLVAQLR